MANRTKTDAAKAKTRIEPLTPARMDDLGQVLRGSWGSSCWCMYPRMSDKEMQALPGEGKLGPRRRQAMTALARRRRYAPGLLAYDGETPVGWIAIAPRVELGRIERSRVTPRVDDVAVWVIPCITVAPSARGRGIAVNLIRAAAAYAFEKGAPAVEAYPRAGDDRTKDDNAYFGTEALFKRAGFRIVRPPANDRPRRSIPRVTMRAVSPGSGKAGA